MVLLEVFAETRRGAWQRGCRKPCRRPKGIGTSVEYQPMRILAGAALLLGQVAVWAADYEVWDEWHNALVPTAGSGTELTLASKPPGR